MTDKRRSRRAKEARRDARRAVKRTDAGREDTTVADIVSDALDEHPCRLLALASYSIDRCEPDTLSLIRSRDRKPLDFDRFLTGLIGERNRSTSALLAVFAALLVEDPERQLRCEQELAQRDDHLPRWITALPEIDVYRAVRRSHVLGDIDEVLIGMRLGGRYELTALASFDHNAGWEIVDGGLMPGTIDETLAPLAEFTDFVAVEMSLADARAWIESELRGPFFGRETESWPVSRPLIRWLITRLPEGGHSRELDLELAEEVCDRFFTTDTGARFKDRDYRELLIALCETGSADPLRWSAKRVANTLRGSVDTSYSLSLLVLRDAPTLLREFIRFAHAESGIRDELTSQTLAVIDKLVSPDGQHGLAC